MESFEIRFVKKHLLFDCNGKKVLVDTGAPVSFCREGQNFEFLGKSFKCNLSEVEMVNEVTGIDMEKIVESASNFTRMLHKNPLEYIEYASESVGEKIDVMMGTDILKNFNVVTDYKGKRISFYEKGEVIDFQEEHSLPMKKAIDGHIGVDGNIGGKNVSFAVDTGAIIQYVSRNYTEGKISERTEEDFHESIGKFETGIYKLDVNLDGQVFHMEFGNLPRMLQVDLGLIGFAGIIGWDFFNSGEVLLDFQGGGICWK